MTGRLVMSRAQGADLQNFNLQPLETGVWGGAGALGGGGSVNREGIVVLKQWGNRG